MNSPKYVAVIGDLVRSKGLKDRNDIQCRLNERFASLRESQGLCSPYTITLGDEFQAVYSNSRGMFCHLFEIRDALYPVEVRFSIGIGYLSTQINREQAIGMDGPAFHEARAGMDLLKRTKTLLKVSGISGYAQALADPALTIIWESSRGWTHSRIQIMLALLKGGAMTEALERVQIGRRAISKNIQKAYLKEWLVFASEAEISIQKVLREG